MGQRWGRRAVIFPKRRPAQTSRPSPGQRGHQNQVGPSQRLRHNALWLAGLPRHHQPALPPQRGPLKYRPRQRGPAEAREEAERQGQVRLKRIWARKSAGDGPQRGRGAHLRRSLPLRRRTGKGSLVGIFVLPIGCRECSATPTPSTFHAEGCFVASSPSSVVSSLPLLYVKKTSL